MKRRPLIASLASTLTAILILAAGCSEQTPTATRLEPTSVAAARGGGKANILQSRHRAGKVSRTVGPQGGTLRFEIGTLTIPPGALAKATEITASVNGVDLSVEFAPHGLVFRKGHEPTLTFDFRHVRIFENSARIQYVDASLNILETVRTSMDANAGVASGRISHFSTYCLAE